MILQILPVLLTAIASTRANIAKYASTAVNASEANSVASPPKPQQNEVLEYILLDNSSPCRRPCDGGPPMTCRYNFTIEWYYAMSKACYDCPYNVTDCFRKDCIPGNGRQRPVVSINRRIPGPAIEVCRGDEVIVDLENLLPGEGTTIHWHGQHQKDTPYMDGVPHITQCPILPATTFRYNFKAVNSGTHFYHSHIGMQRADGAFGPLIVRIPEESNPQEGYYDYDLTSHIITVIDWGDELGLDTFLAHHHSIGDNKPPSILVNGLGRFKSFVDDDNKTIYTPTARFYVEQGYRYRFRVINAGFLNCPIEVSIDNHTMKIISVDGSDVVPIDAISMVSYAGERFDFVLSADQPKSRYWMRFRGLMDCDERFTRANQVAVLEYKGIGGGINDYPLGDDPEYDSPHREGLQINPLNKGTEVNGTEFVAMPLLKSLEKWDTSLQEQADLQFYLAYDFYKIDNEHFHKRPYYGFYNVTATNQQLLTPQFNHISMKLPPFPLLPQRNEIYDDMFCNEATTKNMNCSENHCECPHGIEVPLNAVVELILVDEGFAYNANHPMHLHGYAFRVVGMERLGENITVDQIKKLDTEGKIKRNLLNPPLKDTVTVPDGGYTIVRFHATNPGYWIFHCHIEFHSEIGMALVFKVGKDSEMLPVPQNFPKCGDYLPRIGEEKKCSDNKFVANLEKFLFGNDCVETSGGLILSRIPRFYLILLQIFWIFYFVS